MNRFIEWLDQNLSLKVMAILLAIILWFQAMSDLNPVGQREIHDIPIALQNLDENLVVLAQSAERVTVVVQADRQRLEKLDPREFRAYVDLMGASAGKGSFRVEIMAPADLTAVYARPAQVSVTLDRRARKQVPVHVTLVGAPGTDHAHKPATVRPDYAVVEGPNSRVQLVEAVVAEVDITGATADLTGTVPVRAVDASGNEVHGVTPTPLIAEVGVPIVQLPPAVALPVAITPVGKPAAGYVVTGILVEPATVTVRGFREVLEKLTELRGVVSVEGLNAPAQVVVELELPPGVLEVTPSSVTVFVQVAKGD